jgi:hypothetical protein
LTALREVFVQAKKKITDFHREPDTRVVLIFYFSGHSDGEVLELGRDRLPFLELRRWLRDAGADLRLGIVDSCKSGNLLASKGGTPGPAFQIRLMDDLFASGEALLTSSAADELALESSEIRGSFFTHHFVSGLRGAADSSGDGRVTLAEAYQYAFAHTVTATAGAVVGMQHPVYDYRLAGQGELVLSEISRPGASLQLPSGYDRLLVIQLIRDQVIAELTAGAATHLAVPSGGYSLRAWREGQAFAGRVTVLPGQTVAVRGEELFPISSVSAQSKGSDPVIEMAAENPPSSRTNLILAVGVQPAFANGLGALVCARVGIHAGGISGPSLMANVAVGSGRAYGTDKFTETSALLFGSYRWGWEWGRWRLYAGPELGGGFVFQTKDGVVGTTGVVALGAWGGGMFRLGRYASLTLEGHLPLTFSRDNGSSRRLLLPAAWLGFSFPL